MLAIQINNPNLENQFLEYAKQQQKSIEELVNEAINFFIKSKNQNYEFWKDKEIENIGKIGFISSSFEEDSEDYSKW